MRRRMVGMLISLLSVVIVLVGLRLGSTYAESKQRELYLDRLDDTARLASVAEQALDADDKTSLQAQLDRLLQVYGIRSAVLSRGNPTPISAAGSIDFGDAELRAQISSAEAGVRSGEPSLILPWDSRALAVAEPVALNGDVIGVVVTSSPTGALKERILRGWALIAALGLLALVVFWLLVRAFTRWILKPVRALDDTAHRLASGQYEVRVPPAGGPPELRGLALSFNEMADTVEQARDQQRAFVADASHQIRNPLNALLLRLQYLAITGPPELADELRQAEQGGWRLARLVDELLALAKAEGADQLVTEFDLAALVTERVDAVALLAAERELTVSAPPLIDPVLVTSDRDAVGGALAELLDNAIKYTSVGGRVEVEISPTPDGPTILSVSDTGPGLADGEWELAGNRFWRSPQQQNVPGFGLGLSIAGELLENAGAILRLDRSHLGGLRAQIVLNDAAIALRTAAASDAATVSPAGSTASRPDADPVAR